MSSNNSSQESQDDPETKKLLERIEMMNMIPGLEVVIADGERVAIKEVIVSFVNTSNEDILTWLMLIVEQVNELSPISLDPKGLIVEVDLGIRMGQVESNAVLEVFKGLNEPLTRLNLGPIRPSFKQFTSFLVECPKCTTVSPDLRYKKQTSQAIYQNVKK